LDLTRSREAPCRKRIGYRRSPYMQASRAISAGVGRAITVKAADAIVSSADEVDAAQRDVQGRPDWFTLAYFHTTTTSRTHLMVIATKG
jgi:phage terminase large subunit GpA-like protein